VSLWIVLLFASLGMVVSYADHLVHSIRRQSGRSRGQQHLDPATPLQDVAVEQGGRTDPIPDDIWTVPTPTGAVRW
jgi:hypothetical protein